MPAEIDKPAHDFPQRAQEFVLFSFGHPAAVEMMAIVVRCKRPELGRRRGGVITGVIHVNDGRSKVRRDGQACLHDDGSMSAAQREERGRKRREMVCSPDWRSYDLQATVLRSPHAPSAARL